VVVIGFSQSLWDNFRAWYGDGAVEDVSRGELWLWGVRGSDQIDGWGVVGLRVRCGAWVWVEVLRIIGGLIGVVVGVGTLTGIEGFSCKNRRGGAWQAKARPENSAV
jgi:hypothetical protein